jgi:serine/threonine protein kinase
MIGKTISHYKILKKLGEGGMGVVYKAEDTKLKRIVALKFLPPELTRDDEAKQRFVNEAQAAASLSHSNICTIHEIDESERQIFIAMEYIDGPNLKDKIKTGPLTLDEAIRIAMQVAHGLHVAHEKNIVHRDIKPANIMITSKDQSKIMDFGLAKLQGQTLLTKEGTTLGTISYMSPEQALGEHVDHRADIWALGVMLYEMITGQLPFTGDYDQAVMYSIINETPEPITGMRTGVPMELERIVNKALAKKADERYQHVDEMLVDMKNLVGRQESGRTKHRKAKAAPLRKRQGLIYSGVASLIIISCIVLYVVVVVSKKQGPSDRKSIAVLPFKNLSGDKTDDYFSDGITEDIITQISKISELRIISRTSAMRYKVSNKSLREIGRELNVTTILEGSVRRAGNRVRIVGQLVDARTDEHIWAETYDREMRDIFDIQSDVAQKIALALKIKLSSNVRKQIEKKPTEDLTAYDYYLKGRDYYYRYSNEDNDNAIRLFKKALELDPQYAVAYAGLGDAYAQRSWRYGFESAWLDSAIAISKKGIAIDPDCPESYKALGLAYFGRGWLQKALEANQKAMDLHPDYNPAMANLGWVYRSLGQYDEAFRWMNKHADIAPTDAYSYYQIGTILCDLGDLAKAEYWFDRTVELQPNFDFYVSINKIEKYIEQKMYDQALELCQPILETSPDNIFTLGCAGDAELLSGNYEEARIHYERLSELSERSFAQFSGESHVTRLAHIYWRTGQLEKAHEILSQRHDIAIKELDKGNELWGVPYEIAAIYAIQGDTSEAYGWLQKAIDAGWRNYQMCLIDPQFEIFHGQRRFEQMMAGVKAVVDEMRKRVEEMERK